MHVFTHLFPTPTKALAAWLSRAFKAMHLMCPGCAILCMGWKHRPFGRSTLAFLQGGKAAEGVSTTSMAHAVFSSHSAHLLSPGS